jgi:hypothetical protein
LQAFSLANGATKCGAASQLEPLDNKKGRKTGRGSMCRRKLLLRLPLGTLCQVQQDD